MNLDTPEVRYARSGDVSIAYQVVGDGPVDLLFVPFLLNLVWAWEQPIFVDFCRQLTSFSRLILFDKRGTGLSDRPRDLPTLETRMDDIRAVMDDVGSERAALLGAGSPGGQLCAVFAATYPERVAALILQNTWPRVVSAPDYPFGDPVEDWRRRVRDARMSWGSLEYQRAELRRYLPSFADDPVFEHWYVNHERLAASPGAAARFLRVLMETDIREVLPTVLFTDIVESTSRAAELGDKHWRELLQAHDAAVRAQLARYAGREIRGTGDGFFATFEGPARAIACAHGARAAVTDLGLDLRAGVHTGEVELVNGKVEGIAVHIGARIAAEARPCEVLVSSIVRDLAAGSGIDFEDRGARKLKGVPGELHLFAARLSERSRIG